MNAHPIRNGVNPPSHMHKNWRDISYLRDGTPAQQRAYAALSELKVLESLAAFDATLVSTVCIDIDIPTSDLDIICCYNDAEGFVHTVTSLYQGFDRFSLRRRIGDSPSIVASFHFANWEFEIFGQQRAVEQQAAYRHLCATARVTEIGGSRVRNLIRDLKLKGLKTEPAVAACLGLPGNPYESLLLVLDWSDQEISDALTDLEKHQQP